MILRCHDWLTSLCISNTESLFICTHSNNNITGGVVSKNTKWGAEDTYIHVFTMISPYKHTLTNQQTEGSLALKAKNYTRILKKTPKKQKRRHSHFWNKFHDVILLIWPSASACPSFLSAGREARRTMRLFVRFCSARPVVDQVRVHDYWLPHRLLVHSTRCALTHRLGISTVFLTVPSSKSGGEWVNMVWRLGPAAFFCLFSVWMSMHHRLCVCVCVCMSACVCFTSISGALYGEAGALLLL